MRALFLLPAVLFSFYAGAQYDFSKLDQLLSSNAKTLAGKGGGYEVILKKDNHIIYEKNENGFDLNKTVFIASASKWYSAVVIMRLIDKGILNPDDKVSSYIPSFKNEKSEITIRQCFSHTSGLPGGNEEENIFKKHRFSYEKMVDEIAAMKLISEPGKQFNYGGLSMQVAGRVAEIVTGKKWNKLFEEELVQPLELTSTYFFGSKLNTVPMIAGGVISNAADFLKLLEMISRKGMVDGKRFLSESSLAFMMSNQVNNIAVGYSPFTRVASDLVKPGYGMGNWLIYNGSSTVNSSPGAFGFTPWIDTQKNYYGVIAVQSQFQAVAPVFWKVLQTINKAME